MLSEENPSNNKVDRKVILEKLLKYWWLILLLLIGVFYLLGLPVVTYLLYAAGIIVSLLIFGPWILQLFGPSIYLIQAILEHLRESKGETFGKRFILIPAALISTVAFVTAQSVLSIWIFINSFLVWSDVVGSFLTSLAMLFFGAAPIAMITAPFVIWFKVGFGEFWVVGTFYLLAFFWFSFSKLASPENGYKRTAEYYLGYSPHFYILGALSFQVIAIAFYQFNFTGIGNAISDAGGGILLLFSIIAAFKWNSIRKSLPKEEKEDLYKPSVWIYILGFFTTNILYSAFKGFEVPTAVLLWLNVYFLAVLVMRFFGIFKKKKKFNSVLKESVNEEQSLPYRSLPEPLMEKKEKSVREVNDDNSETNKIRAEAKLIEKTLESFGIKTRVCEVNKLKNEFEYCLEVEVGCSIERLPRLQKDIALALASPTGKVRILAPIPGRSLIGIYVPFRLEIKK